MYTINFKAATKIISEKKDMLNQPIKEGKKIELKKITNPEEGREKRTKNRWNKQKRKKQHAMFKTNHRNYTIYSPNTLIKRQRFLCLALLSCL